MTLSDLTVRQAKAAEKTYSIPDTDGLGLVVAPTGGKSWHLRYYWLGKQKRISLGNYPEIGLREARTLRDEARALLAKGINPHTDRKQKRHAVKLAADQVEAASAHLTIHIEGVPAIAGEDNPDAIVAGTSAASAPPVVVTPIVVTPNDAGITFQRLSQVPPPPTRAPAPAPEVSTNWPRCS
ncbi:hypothetical protein GCM10011505_32130 [Tistrella bauzanensis]|uniref:Integrase DNA-binding domain-containing protein n=1 Tax=Tistrella bauzanensis TaxID=657419 RepID=A0ABQ1IPL4_9PROT|nr:hypothetical protein GCM10011505_32130 [Tistrella bauzanensis]